PGALDISQYRNDLLVAEDVAIRGHVAYITRRRCLPWDQAVLHHIHQHRIRMMPSVAGLVVRRCRQFAIEHAFTPVRLALQRLAMACCAVVRIDRLALHHKGLIRRVDECRAGSPYDAVKDGGGTDDDGADYPKDQLFL